MKVRRYWTMAEICRAAYLWRYGMSVEEMALLLNRPKASIHRITERHRDKFPYRRVPTRSKQQDQQKWHVQSEPLSQQKHASPYQKPLPDALDASESQSLP